MPKEGGVERGFISKHALRADALSMHYIRCKDIFLDVAASATDTVRNHQDLNAALPIVFTIDAQPDCPRTLYFTFTHADITEFTLVVVGVNGKGETVTETFTAASGWAFESGEAYATVTSITLTARTGTGVGDTCHVGCASTLGLSNPVNAVLLAAAVYKVTKNAADWPAASYSPNWGTDVVDVSIGGAIVAGDDFSISYFSTLEDCNALP